MTGVPLAPLKGPPDNPPGPHSDGRTPIWMRNRDEMGQTVTLVLQRKKDEEETDPKKKKDMRLPEPFIIGSSVQMAIGEKESRNVVASREGRGSRYLLRTSSRAIVDKLTKLTKLSDGTEVEIFLHQTLNTIQGIVYEPDSINTDEKLIAEKLSSQGIKSVRRIKKRVSGELENTPSLVLTFHGNVLPSYVFFGLLRIPVRVYYPSPMLCFNCGTYGHSRKFCQQTGICMRCSQPLHVADGEQCINSPYCLHCKNGHSVMSRDCPKYKEEDKIVHMKVDQCISFSEARSRYNDENKRETIARTIQNQLKQELAAKDQMITTLQKQVAALTKELASLKSLIMTRSQSQYAMNVDLPHTQSSTQNLPSTSVQLAEPSQNTNARVSRKDEDRRKGRHDDDLTSGFRTRSRSGKRQFNISPTNVNSKGGKRSLKQKETNHNPIGIDE